MQVVMLGSKHLHQRSHFASPMTGFENECLYIKKHYILLVLCILVIILLLLLQGSSGLRYFDVKPLADCFQFEMLTKHMCVFFSLHTQNLTSVAMSSL